MALIRCGARKLTSSMFAMSSVSIRQKKTTTELPEFIEHATGLERKQLIAALEGNDDIFYNKVMKRGPGTKDNPNLVESFEDKRIIGCICDEDSTCINWIWVHDNEPKRCGCGYWFKLKRVEFTY